jgi:hypothetical protein
MHVDIGTCVTTSVPPPPPATVMPAVHSTLWDLLPAANQRRLVAKLSRMVQQSLEKPPRSGSDEHCDTEQRPSP